MVKILLHGALGKMGKAVALLAINMPDCQIVAGIDALAGEAGNTGFPVYRSLSDCRESADVIIDFSRPEALDSLLSHAQLHSLGLVLCTTGISSAQQSTIKAHSARIPIFSSANMSLGVNLQMELCRKAASLLGEAYDVEIVEKHHNQKVDAPSGTALVLADAIASSMPEARDFTFGRHSKTQKRAKNEIGIHAVRGGTVVGEHNVFFYGTDEVVEITHIATSRDVFAAGALRAAKFISAMPAGMYNMQDIVTGQGMVAKLSVDEQQAVININDIPHNPRVIAELFQALADQQVIIDMISQTMPLSGAVDMAFSLSRECLSKAIDVLQKFEPTLVCEVFSNICKIILEGRMERQAGVAAKLFNLLASEAVKIKLITTSETKIEFCVDQSDCQAAVAAAKKAFAL